MTRRALLGAIAALAVASAPLPAAAQPNVPRAGHGRPLRPPPTTTSDDPGDLRGRFGVERAKHLLQSSDPDERLRGIERAASLGAETAAPEALAVLVQQLDALAITRGDARAKIALARGLAPHADKPAARAALLQIVELVAGRSSSQRSEVDDPLYAARLEVARSIAALALAQSGEAHAVESLVAIARGTTVGTAAATAALSAYPPSGTATWAKPMSAATARLVARTGDLRALGALLEAASDKSDKSRADGELGRSAARSTTDAPTRAAAIEALGTLGDARVLEIAKASLTDDDPRVRTAATAALVTMGAPEAPRAVEQLLADDATAARGIELANRSHGLGVVHALAARAAIAADLGVRSAAVAALGRDPTADGIEALAALVSDPMLRADAADAIARSPSGAAMGAIEHLAASAASRRLGARAYVVRALVRGETSAAMERTVAELARSSEGRDRAVGVFAQIVLGETEAARWLDDGDPAVRCAAAMATMHERDKRTKATTAATEAALLARRAREEDPTTRTVLGVGLLEGDPGGLVPTQALLACTRGGGADAPLCALALARRASGDPGEGSPQVDALLSSPDAIVRAHAARGLASSEDPARGGRLASAYAYEPDPLVRRAILAALALVRQSAPSVADAAWKSPMEGTIALAARLDPDPDIRWTASRLAGAHVAATPDEADIAWIHLVGPSGAPPPTGATGALLRPDGLAVPIGFDADGDALVPGVPPGTARLVLAPRLDAAYARPQ